MTLVNADGGTPISIGSSKEPEPVIRARIFPPELAPAFYTPAGPECGSSKAERSGSRISVEDADLTAVALPPLHPLLDGAGIERALGEVTGQRLTFKGIHQAPRPRPVAAQVVTENREGGFVRSLVGRGDRAAPEGALGAVGGDEVGLVL
jgi:hypothetical protein